ncbi:uncharacterized protein LOC136021822 isoform X3 [Lathamus discolor]|uniref:uncharacterized protein LOC136021822 isoform X3 n=1 Tax=Lathamus discolor TaxID=678569 RepID=UPI0032B79970
MALPSPWRWPSALPLALAVMLTCLAQGSLLGAALGAGGAWVALRSRPPARRPPARFVPPPRPPRLLVLPYRPSLIAYFPPPWARAYRRPSFSRAGNGRPATGVGRRDRALTHATCLGAPPPTVRRRFPLPPHWSPSTGFPPEKRMCVGRPPQSCRGVCCAVPEWTGSEREVRRWSRAPATPTRAVHVEEAVEKPEQKRRQSPSPPPSPGNGRPRRRSICLLVQWDNEPLVLPPAPDPGYPITQEIIEEERKAAQQRLRRLLGYKAEDEVPSTSGEGTSLDTAIAQGSSGTSHTWAASAASTSVVSGLGDASTTGLTDSSQPRSGSQPVLGGSPSPASLNQARSRTRGPCKRLKEEDRSDAKWPFGPPAAKRQRL